MEATNTKETLIKGRGVGSGIAMGEAMLINSESKTVTPVSIKKEHIKKNKTRFKKAKENLLAELRQMSKDLNEPESAEIIDTQLQIIKDIEIENRVYDIIENKKLSVDFAVYQTFCLFIERLKESGSELFRQRIVDLEDIRDRFVALVSNKKNKRTIKKGAIIVASEISPTDLVSYYENGAAGLVMEKGGVTSHAAIIAKSLGMPCIVSAENVTKEVKNKADLILDADDGLLISEPSSSALKSYKKKIADRKKAAKEKRTEVFETEDGIPFTLLANIEFEAEVPKVAENGAKGVGLLRTESLLLGHHIRNSREEQEAFYKQILEGAPGSLTIRLFDIGGDKTGGRSVKEANPFLGWRGIRLLLDEKKLLRNQLAAILRVSGEYPGRIKILVPMVSVLDEVHEVKEQINKVTKELKSEGVKIDENVPLGLMVEVPSVALSANKFAREVDFMSIGTNDLTQYTMAVDRGNERISTLFQHYHPSVLTLIQMTVKGAKKAGIEVSVCGELAGDEIGAACLFGLGIDELSMLPHSIPKISRVLKSHSKKDFEALAKAALKSSSTQEIEKIYKDWKS